MSKIIGDSTFAQTVEKLQKNSSTPENKMFNFCINMIIVLHKKASLQINTSNKKVSKMSTKTMAYIFSRLKITAVTKYRNFTSLFKPKPTYSFLISRKETKTKPRLEPFVTTLFNFLVLVFQRRSSSPNRMAALHRKHNTFVRWLKKVASTRQMMIERPIKTMSTIRSD